MASRDIKDCVDELQEKWPLIKKEYESTYIDRVVKPICTLRSTAEQQALYAQGRTKPGRIVTWKDGVTQYSKHNPIPTPGGVQLSRALDVGVFMGGKYITDDVFYAPLKDLAHKHGLKSGYDFPAHAVDPPHIETLEQD
jgi:peptidoglycan L-alanyl-D-glutamate endopeptidase CwlK